MSIATTYENYSHDWWTPPEWLEWAHASLGTRDVFDPCPRTWRPGDPDGLDRPWSFPAYVNHPGSRGSAAVWWDKYLWECRSTFGPILAPLIWCAFSIEQLRHANPSPLELPGTLVAPRKRVSFIWGGPTQGKRVHGEAAKSPGNWAVFWASPGVTVATPPHESIVVPTGVG
jgi:hypothetical protein